MDLKPEALENVLCMARNYLTEKVKEFVGKDHHWTTELLRCELLKDRSGVELWFRNNDEAGMLADFELTDFRMNVTWETAAWGCSQWLYQEIAKQFPKHLRGAYSQEISNV